MFQRNRNLSSKVFFPNLEGLRFFLFIIVYILHSFLETNNVSIKGSSYEPILRTIFNGQAAMSTFFVMSGFLITYLILHETEIKGRMNLGHFYVRRLLRIWPLYYAVILFTVVLFPFLRSHFGTNAGSLGTDHPIYYYTFLSNFDQIRINFSPSEWLLMQAVTWSVSIEEQFYVVWPLLFFFLPKKYFRNGMIAMIATSLIFRLFNYKDLIVTYHNSLAVFADFAIGGLCGYYALYSEKFTSYIRNLSRPSIILVYLAGLSCTMFAGLDSYIGRLCNTLFVTFVILEQVYATNSFYKFSNNKWFTFWGKYTYGLYLLHAIAIWLCDVILLKVLPLLDPTSVMFSVVRVVGGFYLSLGMAYVSYEFYEKKFLKLKDKFTHTNKPERQKAIQKEEELSLS